MEGPIRMCLACRARCPQGSLLRLALRDGTVTVERPGRPARQMPGRGAYLCPGQECADVALRRDAAGVRRALRLGRGGAVVDTEAIRAAVRTAGAGNEKSAEETAATAASRREAAARGACS